MKDVGGGIDSAAVAMLRTLAAGGCIALLLGHVIALQAGRLPLGRRVAAFSGQMHNAVYLSTLKRLDEDEWVGNMAVAGARRLGRARKLSGPFPSTSSFDHNAVNKCCPYYCGEGPFPYLSCKTFATTA
jgi:hypothetical protein